MAVLVALALAGCRETAGVQKCDTAITVEPVTVQGAEGPVDLDLKATVTDAGRPASGVKVEFLLGWPPDEGVVVGSAITGADGVAHLLEPGGLRGTTETYVTAGFTKYRAEIPLLYQPESAGKSLCLVNAEAAFEYVPG